MSQLANDCRIHADLQLERFDDGRAVTLDPYGRTQVSQVKQSPSTANCGSVQMYYDVNDRPKTATIPYVGTASRAGVTTTGTTIYLYYSTANCGASSPGDLIYSSTRWAIRAATNTTRSIV